MRDLTLSQEYLLCAVNEKGRLPHLGVERTVCLVAAALLELQLEGCVAVDKKYVTVTGPLPEGQAHLRPLYAFVNRPKPIRKRSCWRSTPILSPMLSAMSCWRALGAPWRTWDWSSR